MLETKTERNNGTDLALSDSGMRQSLSFVAESTDRLGIKAFLKGGAVRDLVWNHIHGTNFKPKDLDIFVQGSIHILHGDLLKKGAVLIDRKTRKGSVVFKYQLPDFPDIDIEIGSMIAKLLFYESLMGITYQDAYSSDLRVNSMSLPISLDRLKWSMKDIHDPLNGVRDIEERSLHVSNEKDVFQAGRILNTVRLSLQLGADLPDPTLIHMAHSSSLITKVPYHIIQSEAIKIIESPGYKEGVSVLHGIGLIDAMFPGRVMEAREIFKRWFSGAQSDFTVIMLKPDGMEKQIQVRMIKELREMGIDLAARRRFILTSSKVAEIYPDIRNEWLIPKIVSHLTSGPCEAFLFLGHNALIMARNYIGATALGERPPTGIRGKFADDSIRNIAHSPDCAIELERTVKALFPELPLPK